jgi:GNAT superfamily N-acetyltransferase
MEVRRGSPADLEEVLALAEQYCAADRHPWDPAKARAGIAPLLRDDSRGVVWIVDEGDGPAGYAVVTWSWSVESGGLDALLDEVFVSSRGKGLGSRLIGHLVDDCRRRGIPRIFLETEAHNDRARRLYSRHGFDAEDSIWMVKDL